MTGELVTFWLSGAARRAIAESSWPDEHRATWTAHERHEQRRQIGKGWQYRFMLPAPMAASLADHLESIAAVWECMTAEERGSTDDPRPLRQAVERIRKALGL